MTADTVYATSADHNVYAIDDATVTGILLVQTGGAIGSPSIIVGDTLYVPSQDGNVHAVDRRNGDIRWTFPVQGMPGALVAADGRLIVGTDLAELSALEEAPTGSGS